MPTYQYACTACGEQLEVVQRFTDEPLTECPACAGRLRKVFSPVGVVFKGSGFYRTDSRAASNGKAKAGSATEPAGASESGGGAASGGDGTATGTGAKGSTSAKGSTGSNGATATQGSGSSPSTSTASKEPAA